MEWNCIIENNLKFTHALPFVCINKLLFMKEIKEKKKKISNRLKFIEATVPSVSPLPALLPATTHRRYIYNFIHHKVEKNNKIHNNGQ